MTDLIEQVQAQNLSLVEQAGRVDVTDPASADEAGRLLMAVKKVQKDIDDARLSITRPLDEAKKRAMEQAKAAKRPYEEAQQAIEGSLLEWTLSERRRLAKEQAELELERAELEVAAARAAEEGRLTDAAELQIQRDGTGSVEKLHRAAGTQTRFRWVAEVTDLEALVKSGLEEFLQPNMAALNAYARATKGKSPVPGVTFREVPTLASTSAA